MTKEYIVIFAAIYDDFRIAELEALNTLLSLSLEYTKPCDLSRPYMVVRLPSDEQARLLGSRAVLVRHVIERWADAASYPDLHAINRANSALWEPYGDSASFKVSIASYRSTISEARKRELVEDLSYTGFQGPIVMKDPDVEIVLHEEHVVDPLLVQKGPGAINNCLKRIWLGRKICDGQRRLIDLFDLKKRVYIGNTSMEAGLSLLMANQAQVKPGSLVLDPFCGTGSMLYPAAYFGALVMGSDIDGRQIRGKDLSKGPGVKDSAMQYGVWDQFVDFTTNDLTQHPWRIGGLFDALICDPPYGVRAGAKRLGRKDVAKLRDEPFKMPETGEWSHERSDYIPPSRPWEMSEVLTGLLDFAVLMLKDHGRLVYWLPTSSEEYKEEYVPRRAGLRLVANSCQDFGKWQRRLITMEKVPEGEPERVGIPLDGPERPDIGHANFRSKYFASFR